MGWNYLVIPKLQRFHRWGLGMDKQFHSTPYNSFDYLSLLGLKFIHVSKRGPWYLWPLWVRWGRCRKVPIYNVSWVTIYMNSIEKNGACFQFPVGYPECGWEGQFCQSDAGLGANATAGITCAVTVVFVMASLVVLGFQKYRYINHGALSLVAKTRNYQQQRNCRISWHLLPWFVWWL